MLMKLLWYQKVMLFFQHASMRNIIQFISEHESQINATLLYVSISGYLSLSREDPFSFCKLIKYINKFLAEFDISICGKMD